MTATSSQPEGLADQAIMFADVSGSSALYKQRGNQSAKARIDRAVALMCDISERHGGVVVKTIGDEVMTRFATPAQACEAASAIQQECLLAGEDGAEEAIAVRIGMDFGPTLLDGNDVFGDTVNDAACVAKIARPRQIVITEGLVGALPQQLRECCEEFDRVRIKGEDRNSLIYRFVWETPSQAQNATVVMAAHHLTQKIDSRELELGFGSELFRLAGDDLPFVIGRDRARVHLHVDSGLASRDHCHIVLRRGKYVLIDHSTNGTYVKSPEQPEIYLRREELPLVGSGTITLGRRSSQAPELSIHYSLDSTRLG